MSAQTIEKYKANRRARYASDLEYRDKLKARARAYRSAHVEESRARSAAWYAANSADVGARRSALYAVSPELQAQRRERGLWDNYRLTPAAYAVLLASGPFGPDRCWACGTDIPGGNGSWHVDHDHGCLNGCSGRASCGECVRGLLCRPCNIHNGQTDTIAATRQWLDYLERGSA